MSTTFNHLRTTIRELIAKMTIEKTTKAQNWAWSSLVTAEEMGAAQDQRIADTRAAWASSAAGAGYKVARKAVPEVTITPLWRDANGAWTEGNQGGDAAGYKLTAVGEVF